MYTLNSPRTDGLQSSRTDFSQNRNRDIWPTECSLPDLFSATMLPFADRAVQIGFLVVVPIACARQTVWTRDFGRPRGNSCTILSNVRGKETTFRKMVTSFIVIPSFYCNCVYRGAWKPKKKRAAASNLKYSVCCKRFDKDTLCERPSLPAESMNGTIRKSSTNGVSINNNKVSLYNHITLKKHRSVFVRSETQFTEYAIIAHKAWGNALLPYSLPQITHEGATRMSYSVLKIP